MREIKEAIEKTLNDLEENGGIYCNGELCEPSIKLVLKMIIKNMEGICPTCKGTGKT